MNKVKINENGEWEELIESDSILNSIFSKWFMLLDLDENVAIIRQDWY